MIQIIEGSQSAAQALERRMADRLGLETVTVNFRGHTRLIGDLRRAGIVVHNSDMFDADPDFIIDPDSVLEAMGCGSSDEEDNDLFSDIRATARRRMAGGSSDEEDDNFFSDIRSTSRMCMAGGRSDEEDDNLCSDIRATVRRRGPPLPLRRALHSRR